MTTETNHVQTRFWTVDGFRDDGFRHGETVEEVGDNEGVILPVNAFLALDDLDRAKAAGRIGVLLQPGDDLDRIVPHLAGIALVALAFPAFTDGRSFSKAELLRTRHGYEGPVRAVGDVLIDQLPHMIRTGVTEFEVSNPVTLARLEEGRPGGLSLHYQPAARSAEKTGDFAWRRRSIG